MREAEDLYVFFCEKLIFDELFTVEYNVKEVEHENNAVICTDEK